MARACDEDPARGECRDRQRGRLANPTTNVGSSERGLVRLSSRLVSLLARASLSSSAPEEPRCETSSIDACERCHWGVLVTSLVATVGGNARAQEPSADEPAGARTRAAEGAPTQRLAAAAESQEPLSLLDLPVVGLGTQVALLGPGLSIGGGSLALTYDLGPVGFDVLVGVFLADEDESSVRGDLRVFFPVHRGLIADFSLGAGGGVGYIEPAGGQMEVVWEVLAGAKIRSFVGRNISLEATAGINVFFRDGFESLALGGRLFGGAGFIYFFR